MSTQVVRITNDVEIPYLTYAGQPVLTFALIDRVHNRVEGTASRNFRANRKRFIEGEDFYDLDSNSLDEFRRNQPSIIGESAQHAVIITESGYLMLVKSFTDDLSWQIQRQLVKLYFRVKALAEQPAVQPGLTADQWKVLRDLMHGIENCCKWQGSAGFAVNERIRFTYGLRSSSELRPEHFEEVRTELEGLRTLSDQHHDRMMTLDREFIETVLRPPVSIRKIRAMARKQAQQPPLSY
ncbi:MAG TPA: ORF6N domain-containing protein [Verrucomicrobiota bacterium]|nr:ORF6N domain-containing protein [Verrucomicrobiota bacterium]